MANSIDEYIAEFPAETQTALEDYALIKACVPGATETISYAIPTLRSERETPRPLHTLRAYGVDVNCIHCWNAFR